MLLGDRISFGLLGLFATLLGFVACSADSAIDPNTAGSSHSAAGTPGIAGSSVSLAGASSTGSAGAASGAGSGQGGVASSAGAEGTNTAGAPSGPGGSASTPQAGSAGMTTGGTGPSSAGRGGSAGAAGASAAFRQVSTIFGKNCGIAGCHADKQSPHFSADAMLYATLTAGTVLAECDYNKMIEPGDPSKSALVQLMNRKCGTFTMPPSCNKTTCLSAADLQTLTDWVQAGAPP